MNEEIDRETGEITISAPPSPTARDVMVPLASRECAQVCNALATAQGQFNGPKRTKEGVVKGVGKHGPYEYKYKYSPLEECIAVVQKPLAEAGISRQQYIVWRGNMSFIRTILWHASGQWLAADYPIIQDRDGMAGFAGAVTFAKRQGLCLITGLAPEDDNDAEVEERPMAARPAQTKAAPMNGVSAPEAGAPPSVFARKVQAELSKVTGAAWKKVLQSALSYAVANEGLEAVAAIAEIKSVTQALKNGAEADRREIKDMIDDAVQRLATADGDNWVGADDHAKVMGG